MFAERIIADRPAPADDALNSLNAVALSGAQIEAALRVLAALPIEDSGNPLAQATALQDYARENWPGCNALVAAALYARVTALAKWTAACDPVRQSDAESVLEAAARFPLSDLLGGIGFEPTGFQEMILFIEELPW